MLKSVCQYRQVVNKVYRNTHHLQVRWAQVQQVQEETVEAAGGCPFAAKAEAQAEEPADEVPEKELKHWLTIPGPPSYPYIGSLMWHNKHVKGWRDLQAFSDIHYKHYGDLCLFGHPSFQNGYGKKKLLVMLSNPNQFHKILMTQGQFPGGMLEFVWQMQKYAKSRNIPKIGAFFNFPSGETWRTQRKYLHKGFLGPKDARNLFPMVSKAVELGGDSFEYWANAGKLGHYVNRATFDTITAVLYGRQVETLTERNSRPQDLKLIDDAMWFFKWMADTFQPAEAMKNVLLNYETAAFSKMATHLDGFREYAHSVSIDLFDRYDKDELSEDEQNCFIVQAYERYVENEETELTKSELADILMITYVAGVDTTSALMSWNILSLAQNQDAQEKLYQELKEHTNNGIIDPKLIEQREWLPYLHAIVRETHRLTPGIAGMTKKHKTGIDMDGYRFPPNILFGINWFSIQNDPQYFPEGDVKEFKPERYLKAAVEARKGTPSEIIDHRLLATPFGFGGRACPGQRVAQYQTMCVLSSIFARFKVELTSENPPKFEPYLAGAIHHPVPMPMYKCTRRE